MADRIPDFLTIEEAARLLRIGRTKAYAMSQEWRVTQGESGLKVCDIGGQLRVPRAWLEATLDAPVLSIPTAPGPKATSDHDRRAADEPTQPAKPRRRRPQPPANQLTLPFS